MITDSEITNTGQNTSTSVGGSTGGSGGGNNTSTTSTTTIPVAKRITTQEVTRAFSYSPVSPNITYVQFMNQLIQEVPIVVSNLSKKFSLKVYPSSSVGYVKVFLSGSSDDTVELNRGTPFLINANSNVTLVARITENLDNISDDRYTENISFVVTAVTASSV